MGEAGMVRFPGNLDPRAQEFRPRNLYSHNHLPLFQPQSYSQYPCPPYPSCVGFPQFVTSPVYVCDAGANEPLLTLPPPSPTATRMLLLSSVPSDVSESTVRRELEVFGDVRAVQMERLRDGIVAVHFYDLRQAQAAMVEIREQHMQQQSRLRKHFDALLTQNLAYEVNNLVVPHPLPPPARGLIAGRAVWAQFMIPAIAGVPDGQNQGTLVIFNLDSEIPNSCLKELFEAFGSVKELRETPLRRHQRFVEFYDVRDAAKAIREMNGKEIHGKHVVIQFSRPGGHSKRLSKATHKKTMNSFHSTANHSRRNCGWSLPPPLPLPRKISGHHTWESNVFSKENPNENGGAKNMNNDIYKAGIEETNIRVTSKKISGNRQQQQAKGSRPWKGRRRDINYDPGFLINEDAILESNLGDSRTTVMIKNIPNKYSQKLLLNMLDNHCIHCNEHIADGDDQPLSSYDFVYLPIDFINKCNVGYGFVNLTSPQATWRLYKAFHLQNWEVFNSRKICQVTYARLQGVEALKEHFKNSKFPCEAEEYMPVVFSPPRDGRQLTEPIPIAARVNRLLTKDSEADDEMAGGNGNRSQQEENGNINYVSSNDDGDEADGVLSVGRMGSPRNGGDNGDHDE